jgi:HEAT repeat protein/type 1 glutamine amidotransferase
MWDGKERKGHASLPDANLAIELMGKKTGAYEAVFNNDVSVFRPDQIAQYDAICFSNTVGVLFDDPQLRKSLLSFVEKGKGFVGIHAAAATFVQWPKYDQWPQFGEMLGAYENGGHPWKPNEVITIKVEDPGNPINAPFQGKSFEISDEVFQFQDPYSRDKLHILLAIDTEKTDMGPERRILPERQRDRDLAISWVRNYGKGRVFYSCLGHNPDIYWNPAILEHFLAGIQFALGDLAADATASNQVPLAQRRDVPRSRSVDELNDLLARIASYEYGQSRTALVELGDWVRDSAGTPSLSRVAEARFLEFLKSSATLASKDFICRQLSLIGTGASVSQLASMLTSPDTSNMARYALERIPGDRVNEALRGALTKTSGNERIGIIDTLGNRRDAEAVVPLSRLLQDGNTAAAAAAALGQIGNLPAFEVLANARSRATGDLLDRILDALLACANRLASAGYKQAALKAFQDLNAPSLPTMIRIGALRGLTSGSGEKALWPLADALSSKDLKVQATAIRLLSSIPGEKTTMVMVEHFPNLPPRAKTQMLYALADRGDRQALPLVIESCQSPDVEMRVAALSALVRLGDASVISLLAEAAASKDELVREAARLSLYHLRGSDIDSTIVDQLNTAPPAQKAELIHALGERSAASATSTLFRTAQDPSPEVRRESIRALRELAAPQHVTALLQLLGSVKSDQERSEAERALTAAIRKSEGMDVSPLLTVYPSSNDVPFRGSLLQVLGSLGKNDGLPLLKSTLKESNPELKRSAILALSEWPNALPASELLAIAEKDLNPSSQILALRGYIKLVSLPESRSAAETVKLLGKAMVLSQRTEEKRLVLAALPQFPCPEALQLAESTAGDSALSKEAKLAVSRIKDALDRKR